MQRCTCSSNLVKSSLRCCQNPVIPVGILAIRSWAWGWRNSLCKFSLFKLVIRIGCANQQKASVSSDPFLRYRQWTFFHAEFHCDCTFTADWSVVCKYFWDEDAFSMDRHCKRGLSSCNVHEHTNFHTDSMQCSSSPLTDSCTKYQWTWWQHPTLPWCRARGLWALLSQQEAPLPKQPIIVILCSSDCMKNEEELDWGFLWQHTAMAPVWPQREDCYSKGGEKRGPIDRWMEKYLFELRVQVQSHLFLVARQPCWQFIGFANRKCLEML